MTGFWTHVENEEKKHCNGIFRCIDEMWGYARHLRENGSRVAGDDYDKWLKEKFPNPTDFVERIYTAMDADKELDRLFEEFLDDVWTDDGVDPDPIEGADYYIHDLHFKWIDTGDMKVKETTDWSYGDEF